MECINVLLADNHPIFLAGIRGILAHDPSIHVVAETQCTTQLLPLAEKFLPDLIICGAFTPPATSTTTIQTLKEQRPEIKILIISEIDEKEIVLQFLALSIDGYILKEDDPNLLLQAIQEVMKDGIWLSPRLIKQLLGCLFTPYTTSITEMILPPVLSKREMEVLRLVAMGFENNEIANTLCITKRTVQNHVSAIYQKLNIKSRSQAVLYAIRQGMVKY